MEVMQTSMWSPFTQLVIGLIRTAYQTVVCALLLCCGRIPSEAAVILWLVRVCNSILSNVWWENWVTPLFWTEWLHCSGLSDSTVLDWVTPLFWTEWLHCSGLSDSTVLDWVTPLFWLSDSTVRDWGTPLFWSEWLHYSGLLAVHWC